MNTKSVKRRFTAKRRRDLPAYQSMVRRVIAAHGRRVADADPEDLPGLVSLHEAVEDAISVAIDGQRRTWFSWTSIGRGLGTSRQNVFQRYGPAGRVR